MKKIMFNDKYKLTQAVLEGIKTNTRRIISLSHEMDFYDFGIDKKGKIYATFIDAEGRKEDVYPKYQKEDVAIAQGYRDAGLDPFWLIDPMDDGLTAMFSHGWNNKMFVLADLMPHRIRINNIRVECLQDISDEDCLKEGIYVDNNAPEGVPLYKYIAYSYDADPSHKKKKWWFTTPREAFAKLIDKVSGKGTWESNPYVFVYDFELIK